MTPSAESSSAIAYSSTNSAGSVSKASSTAYFSSSSSSTIAYTSTGLDASVTSGSTISYAAVATPYTNYDTLNSAGSVSAFSSTPTFPMMSAPPGSGSGPGGFIGPGSGGSGNGSSSSPYYLNYTKPSDVLTSTTSIPDSQGTSTSAAASGAATTAGSDSDSDATATTNGGPTPASNDASGAEPTVATPTPSCVQSSNYAGNNTKYMDYFGYTYDIRCNLDLQSTPADHDAYAESFEDCLEYCSLLTDCVAVSYQDPPSTPNNVSNCYPKWNFVGYSPSASDGVYSGVNVNGASDGTLQNQDLCTTDNYQGASYAGIADYDDFGTAWTIGCNNTLAISDAAALSTTVTDTLASCIDYCSRYDSCEMVNWTGPHVNGTANDPNCFPASSIGAAGAAGSAPGSGYAMVLQ